MSESDMDAEAEFFKRISKSVLNLVSGFSDRPEVTKQKGRGGDYATELDIAVEDLIVAEIKKTFPGDDILAEEGHSTTAIGDGRIWIIDPICGTNNIGRGIKNYCTNIALAENKQLIAACVVDHACQDIIWSVGNGEVSLNGSLFKPSSHELGVTLDFDIGALNKCSDEIKSKHSRFMAKLLLETDYMLLSLNTSLGFAYTAVGKLDGFMNPSASAWDICASVFLIQQVGGTVTDLEGKPWDIDKVHEGTTATLDKDVHVKLVELYKKA